MDNAKETYELTLKIVLRAEQMGIVNKKQRITSLLDVGCAYLQFNIDLKGWLESDDENFAHDFVGIISNIDRQNKNFGFFVPRFAKKER